MTDTPSGDAQALPVPTHPPFPFARLLLSVGFAVLAWLVGWVLLFIGLTQFVVLAVNGAVNEELKQFSLRLVQYLWELLAYITFVRDERPFPIGSFPKHV